MSEFTFRFANNLLGLPIAFRDYFTSASDI